MEMGCHGGVESGGMMKKRNLRKGFGDWKRDVERNEEESEHGKRRTRSLKRKCQFRITLMLCKNFAFL